jgi:PKD repeat protein
MNKLHYFLLLILFFSCSEKKIVEPDEVEPVLPVASFTFALGEKGSVKFTNTSKEANSYAWDFGDGKTATEEHPEHTFTTNGAYTVTLTAENKDGKSIKKDTININTRNPPVANFTFVIDKGKVTFTNSSTHAESYSWTFGDGKSSTEQNPVHQYAVNQSYNVKLTAKSSLGEHSIEKAVNITGIPPVTPNQTIYLSVYTSKQLLQARDASSGELIWEKDGYEGRIGGAISVVGGTLYFTTDRFLYAVDANNGNVKWRFAGGSAASPLVLNNVVYYGSNNGKVYAVNTSNGSLKWEREVAAGISAPVIIQDKVLYVGTLAPANGGGIFYAIHTDNGNIKWQRGTYGGSMNTKAVVSGNLVYFGGSVGFHILNKDHGEGHEGLVAYSFRQVLNSSPIVSDNHVFAVFGGSEMSRVDIRNDASIWNQSLQASNHTGSPLLIGEKIYITGQNRVYALNKSNGAGLWSFAGSNFNSRNVTHANNLIYVADNKGGNSELLALDAGSGSVLFRTTIIGSVGDLSVLAKDGKVTYPGSTGQQ